MNILLLYQASPHVVDLILWSSNNVNWLVNNMFADILNDRQYSRRKQDDF